MTYLPQKGTLTMPDDDTLDLSNLQRTHAEWCAENFDDKQPQLDRQVLHAAMGAGEEAGELLHALLKWDQSIRGGADDHEAEAKDAVGDITLYLLDLCSRMGWSFEDILRETTDEVHGREW